jgi:hypothetical protein
MSAHKPKEILSQDCLTDRLGMYIYQEMPAHVFSLKPFGEPANAEQELKLFQKVI